MTTEQDRKPLTDEQIEEARSAAEHSWNRHMGGVCGQMATPADDFQYHFARAIERAHRIYMETNTTRVIKFSSPDCKPCKMMQPIWDELKAHNPQFEFIEVDIEDQPITAAAYNIRTVPAFVIRKPHYPDAKITGFQTLHKLKAFLGI